MNDPVLTKHPADPRCDYKPMTWERFLLLRAWAKWIAWSERCTVALVGSTLEKTVPRDIDIALIWPVTEFKARFSSLLTDEEGHNRLWKSRAYEDQRIALYISAQKAVNYATRIDVRLCPDCWWPEKDRLILATPTDTEPPNVWDGLEFVVHKILRKGDPGWEGDT